MPAELTYLVCCTQRSGSSLLCDLLHNTGLAGNPQEFFSEEFEHEWAERWLTHDFSQYLNAALDRTSTPNGVFGAKVMYEHLDYLAFNLRQALDGESRGTVGDLFAAFPNLHFIFIRREDVVRQAVSHWRATQTAIWNDDGQTPQPATVPVYDFAAIEKRVRRIRLQNHSWHAFFHRNSIDRMEITYESLVPRPGQTTRAILEYLGISIPEQASFPGPNLRRQADALSEEWVARYQYEHYAQSFPEPTRPARDMVSRM